MPPTDLEEPRVKRTGVADARRANAAHRAKALVVLALVLVLGAAVAIVATRSGDDVVVVQQSTTTAARRSTTTSTSASTTTVPPTPTSVPGLTVGPLIGGPGPIPVLHRIPTTDPVVFLTIDDGAYPDQLALELIRDHKIPVTMFLNQNMFRANSAYFQQLQAAGAVIGTHTSTHPNLRGKDAAFQHAEICDMNAQFNELFGHMPTLFRPPYGNYDPTTLQQAASCGITTVLHWSAEADTGHIVTAEGPLRAGDIILMHFKPGLGLKLISVLQQIQATGLRPAQLNDYVISAPPAPPTPAPPVTTDPAITAPTEAPPLAAPAATTPAPAAMTLAPAATTPAPAAMTPSGAAG